ncbi:hypothetical protein LX69_00800 [Breznakibacter xylanolyticus]|uniref:Uncharacterized protein n=1 Tax=Breznakibacter xylanolyticus TaxID=990 RepID=A0A2W7NGJ4_9BACT|nr:hypothetical protein LX69_00800 [Breznakibacter xylanolyticus]
MFASCDATLGDTMASSTGETLKLLKFIKNSNSFAEEMFCHTFASFFLIGIFFNVIS